MIRGRALRARARVRWHAPRARRAAVAPAPPERAGARAAIAGAIGFAGVLAYAVVRYAVVAGEPLASVPLWTTNKAVAVFAIALVAASAVRPGAAWRRTARAVAGGAAALHALASLALLRPAYYPRLFAGGPDGRMSAAGELAILCGAGALVAVAALRLARPAAPRPTTLARRAGAVCAALVVAHCAALGLPGWLAPRTWPGGLPPMSLAGALLAAGVLAAGRARRAIARSRRQPSARSPALAGARGR